MKKVVKFILVMSLSQEVKLMFWEIFFGVLAFLIFVVLATSFICFYKIFYSQKSKRAKIGGPIEIPDGEIYEPFREDMVSWVKEVRAMPCKEVEITSFDGLLLCGRFYCYEEGAPIEILLHGYRGNSERDLSAGVLRCFKRGRSALLIDHRGSGRSEGNVITFGINESRDLEKWVELVANELSPNSKIIITGVSMGAATVMIAASRSLPGNVVAALADCGYTSGKEIIKKVMREMKLPADVLYPFARLGGKLFGGFDIDEFSPIESMKNAKIPVIFIHGDTDDFVPCDMSRQNFEACITQKKLVIIKNAGHGICYPVDPELYLASLDEFFTPLLTSTKN